MAHLVTGKVRLSYEHIWEPASINGSDEKYSVSLIIPKSDTKTVKAIQDAIEQAKQDGKAKFGGRIPANLKLPLRDGDIERPDDEAYQDSYFINCNSKDKPQIVDKNVQPILDRNEVYSGCYARVSISLYPFNTNGNRGIACGLGNIQKVADGEPLGGRTRAEDDFEAYIDVFNSLIDNREEIISLIEQTVERLMDTKAIDKRLFIAKGSVEGKQKTVQEYMALNGKVVIDQKVYNEKFDRLMEIYQAAEDEYTRIKREKTELMDRCKRCKAFIKTLRNSSVLQEFDEGLFCGTVEKITVFENRLEFEFKDGTIFPYSLTNK